MAISDELKRLVDEMPDPDDRGMYCENIDKERIEQAVAKIAQGGAAHVAGLIGMLGQPGSADDVKPHYALHCVVNHALAVQDEPLRKTICETIAGALSDEQLTEYNRAYLCQLLQWAGRDEACAALGQVLLNESLSAPAAMALTAIGGASAAAQLRAAAPQAAGPCRLNVVNALAVLGDAEAAATFLEAIQDGDREVRLAAGAGLAWLGDAAAVSVLLKAADGDPGWERIQQTKHCLVLAEKLVAAGQKAEADRIYEHLRDTRTDPTEEYIRAAAEAALA